MGIEMKEREGLWWHCGGYGSVALDENPSKEVAKVLLLP